MMKNILRERDGAVRYDDLLTKIKKTRFPSKVSLAVCESPKSESHLTVGPRLVKKVTTFFKVGCVH